jgi:hypothetical protein
VSNCFGRRVSEEFDVGSDLQVLVAPDKDYILIVLQKTKKPGVEDPRE